MTSRELDLVFADLVVRDDSEAVRHLARAVFWAVGEMEGKLDRYPDLLNVWDRLKTAVKRLVLEKT